MNGWDCTLKGAQSKSWPVKMRFGRGRPELEDPLGERLPPKGEDRPGLGRRGEQVLPVEEPVLSHEVAERGPLLLVAVEAAAEAAGASRPHSTPRRGECPQGYRDCG